jgi:hypothetical protein
MRDGRDVWVFGEALHRAAAVADPLCDEELPPVERIVAGITDAEGVALYRHLAGPLAGERLQTWVRAPLAWPVEEPGAAKHSRFLEARARAAMVPDLVPLDVQRWLYEEARGLSTSWMLDLLGRRELPWLLDEATVAAAALERAETERERWSWGDCAKLPDSFLPAVQRRVLSDAPDDAELVGLLRWLETRGAELGDLVAALLRFISHHKLGTHTHGWLRDTLDSRTRWSRHGRDVLLTLIELEAWDQIIGLVGSVLRACDPTKDPDGEERHRIALGIHDAFARALVRVTERALARGATDEAIGALHGLAALHPLTSVRRLVHHLHDKPGVTAEVAEFIRLNEELLRRDTTREAGEHDVTTALALFAERRKAPLPAEAPELSA